MLLKKKELNFVSVQVSHVEVELRKQYDRKFWITMMKNLKVCLHMKFKKKLHKQNILWVLEMEKDGNDIEFKS